MCGIAGFVDDAPPSDSAALLARMSSVLRHRGPDESGVRSLPPAFLAHQRLSIIDLATGQQPMCNERRTLWIVYNGEIFNHRAIRSELEKAGHVYRTRSDTETILHAYEEYGEDCVRHLRGMFAFAIWDTDVRRLFCARDRLGIKPFYYFWDGRLFVFASEIKALFEHPSITARLERDLLPEYLAFGYVSEERTLFSGIRKLMPGHVLVLDRRSGSAPGLKTRMYWDVPVSGQPAPGQDENTYIRECRARLEETVSMRLMSDVPLGMFLSGGVDSSAIAALMMRMSPGPVKTFAVGYPRSKSSELDYARSVAAHLGTEHREVMVGMEEFFDALPRMIWHEDEPVAWPSSVSLHFVSRLAAREVKVVLTGEGADELFGGYARYRLYRLWSRWLRWYRLLPADLRRSVRDWVASSGLLSAGLRRRLQHTIAGRDDTMESLYLDNFYSAFSASNQRDLAPGAGRWADSPYRNFHRYWDGASGLPRLSRMLYADQKTYLVELLMKQDQMSMSASIESRVPFLDHPLVEFAARVPEGIKIRGATGKYILKRAVEDLLPSHIIHRKKMGFPTPLREWLMDPRAGRLFEILLDRSGLLASCLELRAVEALVAAHRNGTEDATDRIWRLLNLQLWGDVFLTGRRDRWSQGVLASARAGGAA